MLQQIAPDIDTERYVDPEYSQAVRIHTLSAGQHKVWVDAAVCKLSLAFAQVQARVYAGGVPFDPLCLQWLQETLVKKVIPIKGTSRAQKKEVLLFNPVT